jgi:lipoprotein NlpI
MLLPWVALLVQAQEPTPSDRARERATEAVKSGNMTNALTVISDAIKADPKDARLWNFRAQLRSLLGDSSGAVTDLTEGIRINPKSGFLHQDRAVERFKMGQITEAVSDFDRANELNPELVPYNWQRGIALYYAKRYADGRKQFEDHRTVNPNDVENAVWHFLCVARAEGTNAAHKVFMPITSDSRVPMAEIHELFAGEAPESEVVEAANAVTGSREEQRQARFHALLYLGLYADVLGRSDEARGYLKQAVDLAAPRDFMGHVARVHLNRLGPAPAAPAASAQP